jgi:hypothetical protein
VIHFAQCVHKSVDEPPDPGDVIWTTAMSPWTGLAVHRWHPDVCTSTTPTGVGADLRQLQLSTTSTKPNTTTRLQLMSQWHDNRNGAQLWTTMDVSPGRGRMGQ